MNDDPVFSRAEVGIKQKSRSQQVWSSQRRKCIKGESFFFHLSGGLSPWWDYGRQRKVLVTNRHLFGKEVVSKTLTKMNEFNSIELGV